VFAIQMKGKIEKSEGVYDPTIKKGKISPVSLYKGEAMGENQRN
jgi:hypothetical protein